MLIDAALTSPTARNRQYWHFSVVQDQALPDGMNRDLVRIMCAARPEEQRGRFEDPLFHVFCHAPTVIFVSIPGKSDNPFAGINAGIAVEDIALSAQGMGLDSVIIGLIRDLFLSAKEGYCNEKPGIPEGWRYAIAIAVGQNTAAREAHPIGENKVTYVR